MTTFQRYEEQCYLKKEEREIEQPVYASSQFSLCGPRRSVKGLTLLSLILTWVSSWPLALPFPRWKMRTLVPDHTLYNTSLFLVTPTGALFPRFIPAVFEFHIVQSSGTTGLALAPLLLSSQSQRKPLLSLYTQRKWLEMLEM